MKKQTFLYQKESVFKACVKALTKSNYTILSADATAGQIYATNGGGFLEAKIAIEISLEGIDSNHTSANICTRLLKTGLLKKTDMEAKESMFMDMLYRCMNARSSYYMTFNEESQRQRIQSARARMALYSSSGSFKDYAYELI